MSGEIVYVPARVVEALLEAAAAAGGLGLGQVVGKARPGGPAKERRASGAPPL
jgi:hypothetical protein